MKRNMIAVCVGGALGSLLRYTFSLLLVPNELSTLAVNVLGSYLLGLLTGYVLVKNIPEWLKVGMGIGFCGGFTTMSTFAADTISLYQLHSLYLSGLYVIISVFGGIMFAMLGLWMGLWLGKRWKKGKERAV